MTRPRLIPFQLALLCVVTVNLPVNSQASQTNILPKPNPFGGRTIIVEYEPSDMEYLSDGDSWAAFHKDRKGADRMITIRKLESHRDIHGDVKIVHFCDTNGRIRRTETHRRDSDVFRDGWYLRTMWTSTSGVIDHIEYDFHPKAAKLNNYYKKREEYDPEGRLAEEWIFFTRQYWRDTGEKYEVTYYEYSPYRRILATVLCRSNSDLTDKGIQKKLERFGIDRTFNTATEYHIDPALSDTPYYRMTRTFVQGVAQNEEYLFKSGTAATYGILTLDPLTGSWSKLSILNERRSVIKALYGEKAIREYLGDRRWR